MMAYDIAVRDVALIQRGRLDSARVIGQGNCWSGFDRPAPLLAITPRLPGDLLRDGGCMQDLVCFPARGSRLLGGLVRGM